MKTSYFARYRGADGVSIALKPAPGFKGASYPDLFPKWSFLNRYKQDRDERAYIRAYHKQVLSKLDPAKVHEDLKDKTLLCWEGPDKFCHRRLVADWLMSELGISVPEEGLE